MAELRGGHDGDHAPAGPCPVPAPQRVPMPPRLVDADVADRDTTTYILWLCTSPRCGLRNGEFCGGPAVVLRGRVVLLGVGFKGCGGSKEVEALHPSSLSMHGCMAQGPGEWGGAAGIPRVYPTSGGLFDNSCAVVLY